MTRIAAGLAGFREGDAMAGKPMLHGRELSAEQLETIRRDIESFDTIDVMDDEMRALIESQWPHLLAKLCPAKPHQV